MGDRGPESLLPAGTVAGLRGEIDYLPALFLYQRAQAGGDGPEALGVRGGQDLIQEDGQGLAALFDRPDPGQPQRHQQLHVGSRGQFRKLLVLLPELIPHAQLPVAVHTQVIAVVGEAGKAFPGVRQHGRLPFAAMGRIHLPQQELPRLGHHGVVIEILEGFTGPIPFEPGLLQRPIPTGLIKAGRQLAALRHQGVIMPGFFLERGKAFFQTRAVVGLDQGDQIRIILQPLRPTLFRAAFGFQGRNHLAIARQLVTERCQARAIVLGQLQAAVEGGYGLGLLTVVRLQLLTASLKPCQRLIRVGNGLDAPLQVLERGPQAGRRAITGGQALPFNQGTHRSQFALDLRVEAGQPLFQLAALRARLVQVRRQLKETRRPFPAQCRIKTNRLRQRLSVALQLGLLFFQ